MNSDTAISPYDVKNKIDSGEPVFILDVREADEYENWRISGSFNLPLSKIMNANGNLSVLNKDREIVTVCLHGIRSENARQMLSSVGYNVRTMSGGMVAWNSVYDIIDVNHGGVNVLQFRRVGKGCISYMLISSNEAVVIDPNYDINVYTDEAKKRNVEIKAVLDTHTHADHVSGGRSLADAAGAIYYSPDDKGEIDHEDVKEGSKIKFGNSSLGVIHTPGHTIEGVTYILDDFAFTGDTLFVESIGRPDLAQKVEENAAILWATLHEKLLALPGGTLILPAHYSGDILSKKNVPITASVGELKNNLDALSMTKEEFVQWIKKSTTPKPENFQIIKDINRDFIDYSTSEETVHELEAGPNRCSVG